MNKSTTPSALFSSLVTELNSIGKKKHAQTIQANVQQNVSLSKRSIKDLSPQPAQSAIVISGGPSVLRKKSIEQIAKANYAGAVISADASYISCLRRGVVPDYLLTLDPHPTRIVRWFGDYNYEQHSFHDDYFERQDINEEFRKNSIQQNKENIELVNKYGHKTKAIVATTAPKAVVDRILEAKFDVYWWNPLVDNPKEPESLTRAMHRLNKLPCLNTGGNVGTASWVFASTFLKIPEIALVGMDLGYYGDTPYERTQTYYELLEYMKDKKDLEEYFCKFEFPLNREKFYTDPTYYWYRKNFLQLFDKVQGIKTYNCTEGGTLFNENLECIYLEDFLGKHYG